MQRRHRAKTPQNNTGPKPSMIQHYSECGRRATPHILYNKGLTGQAVPCSCHKLVHSMSPAAECAPVVRVDDTPPATDAGPTTRLPPPDVPSSKEVADIIKLRGPASHWLTGHLAAYQTVKGKKGDKGDWCVKIANDFITHFRLASVHVGDGDIYRPLHGHSIREKPFTPNMQWKTTSPTCPWPRPARLLNKLCKVSTNSSWFLETIAQVR